MNLALFNLMMFQICKTVNHTLMTIYDDYSRESCRIWGKAQKYKKAGNLIQYRLAMRMFGTLQGVARFYLYNGDFSAFACVSTYRN